MDIVKNHGVLQGSKTTDWVAGTIPFEVRNPSGDWTPFLVRTEKQWYPSFDTMGCVSFSANNVCEIQIKQQTGVEVNFSDRFLAKMSGTTKSGNWLYIVGDTLRKIGGVHEEEWPALPHDAKYGWDDYYVDIPQFVKDKAKSQFLDNYNVNYELIWNGGKPLTSDVLEYHLKHAPLWVTIPGHAIAGIVVSVSDNKFTYFDTYDPFLKTVPISYLDSVWKIVLTVKNMKPEFVHIVGTPQYGLLYTNEFVKTVVLFTSEADAKDKLKTQVIDWSKARDITI